MAGDKDGGSLRPLTPREAEFVRQYVELKRNGSQAAIAAGYAESGSRAQATRLLARANIQAALSRLEIKADDAALVDRAWVLTRLRENVEQAMQIEPVFDREGVETGEFTYQGSVANRALELLGKELGMFKDQVEHGVDEKLQSALGKLAEARAKKQARRE
jgi:phage terminase small subunit